MDDPSMIRRRQWWYQSWVKVDSAPFSHELHVCILHTFIRCRVTQLCQKLSFKKLPPPRPLKFLFWTHGFQKGNQCKIMNKLKISEGNFLNFLTFGKLGRTKFRQHQYLKVLRRSENWSWKGLEIFMRGTKQNMLRYPFYLAKHLFTYKDLSDIDIPVCYITGVMVQKLGD